MFCDCPKSKLAIFLAYSALFATALSAQDYRGRIQGTVWEAAKAVIPGATVTLTNTTEPSFLVWLFLVLTR